MRCSARAMCLLVALAAGSGCAALAKKPPTPADDIPAEVTRAMTAAPGERFLIIVFGSQSVPKRAKFTHTWATMVRVTGADTDAPAIAEEVTISWMPATLDIRPLAMRPEPGTNLSLHDTFRDVLRHDERVSVWGPYEVSPGFFYRFKVQKEFLESGQIGYQCVDTIGEAARQGNGCCCIHAITDMDPIFDRGGYPLIMYGEAASGHIVHELHTRPILIDPHREHPRLLTALGLDQYPLVRRTYTGRSVPFGTVAPPRPFRKNGRP
jgi:hypothetical protein